MNFGTDEGVERIREIDSSICTEALAIYLEAFPEHERQPIAVVQERIATGKNQLFVRRIDDAVAVMALFWPFSGTRFVLLDYLAVEKSYRGRGLASEFLREIFAAAARDDKYLLIEIEDPAFGANVEERARRLAFYRRAGAKILAGVPYLLPPLQGNRATEMLLLISPNFPSPTIGREKLRAVITRLYCELYSRSRDDPLLNAIVRQLPDEISLV